MTSYWERLWQRDHVSRLKTFTLTPPSKPLKKPRPHRRDLIAEAAETMLHEERYGGGQVPKERALDSVARAETPWARRHPQNDAGGDPPE